MKVDVVTEADIAASVEVVSSYSADPTNAPQWYANIKSVEWVTSPLVAVGGQVAFVAHFLRRRLAYTYEIIDLVPGERLVMRTAEGPFRTETTYLWAAIDAGSTRMTLSNRGEPAGFSKIMAPMMASAMRRANRKDLDALRRILEPS